MKIKGKVTKILYPKVLFEDVCFSIIKFKIEGENIIAKGEMPSFSIGENLILEGEFEKDPKWGNYFQVENLERDLSTQESMSEFIALCCGAKTAKKVLDRFGSEKEVLRIFEEDPHLLTEVDGIKEKKFLRIFNKYQRSARLMKSFSFFKNFGFSVDESRKTLKLGRNSLEMVKKNPFVLVTKLNFSFERIDKIYQNLGFNINSSERYDASLISSLRDELRCGHCFANQDDIVKKARSLLSFGQNWASVDRIKDSLQSLIKKGVFVLEVDDLYFSGVYNEKMNLCAFVKRALSSSLYSYDFDIDKCIKEYEEMKTKETHIKYALGIQQKEAVKNSLLHQTSIITGGPGTGKTTVLDCLLYIYKNAVNINPEMIALCSPTGKASKRMTESTGMPATTIHRLLKVEPNTVDTDKQCFVYNKGNKLKQSLFVVDESSMLDYSLASSLIDAIKSNSRIVFVGDINQLPPVSYGYTLRDFIESGIPTVKLVEVKRQKGDSSIIPLSQMIRDDKLSLFRAKDFGMSELKSVEQVSNIFMRGLEILKKEKVYKPLDEIVVLTPQNKGDFGTKNLNIIIQNKLIPNPELTINHNGYPFVVGSKVLQVQNDNENEVVNGEVGYVRSIDLSSKTLEVEFDDGKRLAYDSEMLDRLKLGYVMTVHKSQGSEWRYVIEIVSKTSKMNTKSLVYTGVTRTKDKLVILGDSETFLNCPKIIGSERRSKLLN